MTTETFQQVVARMAEKEPNDRMRWISVLEQNAPIDEELIVLTNKGHTFPAVYDGETGTWVVDTHYGYRRVDYDRGEIVYWLRTPEYPADVHVQI